MLSLDWTDWTMRSLEERKFPSRRRRAKWKAEAQFRRLVQQLRPGSIAIDCGANVGHFTQALGARGATVYAFEPDPYAFAQLRANVGMLPGVYLRNQAVGTSSGPAVLYRAEGFADDPDWYTQSSSLYAGKTNIDPASGVAVEQIDLVAFIGSLPHKVALLKMDIEGAEVPVLERLLDTGAISRVEHVFVETHENRVPELASRTRVLRARIAAEQRSNINLDWA